MMKPRFRHPSLFLASVLLITTALTTTGVVLAANPIVEIEGMQYRMDQSLTDNLKALQGRTITLTLDSGSRVTGRLEAVANGLLHLSRLKSASFMDALVRVDRVIAVEAQFRAYQRDLERLKKQ